MRPKCSGPVLGLTLAIAFVSAALSEDSHPTARPEVRDTGKSSGGKDKSRPGRDLPGFTSEREAAALTFISLHHAEMAELLRQLKGTNPADYKREIRLLFRSSETLADLKDSDPDLYELELKAWVLDSRIRLLAARLSMAHSDSIERELRQALSDQIDVRMAHHALTRRRLEARLAELDTQMERLAENRDEQIDRRFKSLLNGKGQQGKARGKNRPE